MTLARSAGRSAGPADAVGDDPRAGGLATTLAPQKAWVALRRASRDLRSRAHALVGGDTLGVLLASEGVDSDAVGQLEPEWLARVTAPPGVQDPHFYEAFANFPDGRNLQALARSWRAHGPHANVYGSSLADLEIVATILLETARAERLLVGAVTRLASGEVEAELAVLEGRASGRLEQDVRLGPRSLVRPAGGESVASLAERSLSAFLGTHEIEREGAAVVFATFLGSTAEVPYCRALGLAAARDFRLTLADLAAREGFETAIFLGGFPGAGLSALMVGSDLIRTRRAERVVVCGADLAQGAMNDSLSIIGCEIASFAVDGSACVLLERGGTGERIEVAQFTPEIRPRRPVRFDVGQPAVRAVRGRSVSTVVTTGCTDLDMRAAGEIAERLWPDATVRPKESGRMLATDVLAILAESESPVAIVSANTLGGTGAIVTSPSASASSGTADCASSTP